MFDVKALLTLLIFNCLEDNGVEMHCDSACFSVFSSETASSLLFNEGLETREP